MSHVPCPNLVPRVGENPGNEVGYVPVNSYVVDNKKRFLTFAGISKTSNQSLLLLPKRSWILSVCLICSNRMTWGVIEEMLYILYDMVEKIIKSLFYLYFLKRVFGWQKSYSLCILERGVNLESRAAHTHHPPEKYPSAPPRIVSPPLIACLCLGYICSNEVTKAVVSFSRYICDFWCGAIDTSSDY